VAALAPQRFVAGGAAMNSPVPEALRRFIWDIQSMWNWRKANGKSS
jgi:hypothetical protein